MWAIDSESIQHTTDDIYRATNPKTGNGNCSVDAYPATSSPLPPRIISSLPPSHLAELYFAPFMFPFLSHPPTTRIIWKIDRFFCCPHKYPNLFVFNLLRITRMVSNGHPLATIVRRAFVEEKEKRKDSYMDERVNQHLRN